MNLTFINHVSTILVITVIFMNFSCSLQNRITTDQKPLFFARNDQSHMIIYNYKTRKEKLLEDFLNAKISNQKFKEDSISIANDDHSFAEIFARGVPGPSFPGCKQINDGTQSINSCSKEKLIEFIQNQLKISKSNKRLQEVAIKFIVSPMGKISTAGVEKGLDADSEDALQNAILELNNFESWSPAWYHGQKIFVYINLKLLIEI